MTVFVAIVGSRAFPNMGMVREFVREQIDPKKHVVVSGGYALKIDGHRFGCECANCYSLRQSEGRASGVDQVALETAWEIGANVVSIPAHWVSHKKGAGFRRNPLIAQLATYGVAFYDGASRGTGDTISHFKRLNKFCFEIFPGDELPTLDAISPPDEYPILDWT